MKTTGFVGTWHIREMEVWGKEYFNMEIDGRTVNHPDGKTRFEFTWEGNDECDDASGAGWFRLKDDDDKNAMIEGEINIHNGGDSSMFVARRTAERKKERPTDKPKKRHASGSTRSQE